MLNNKIYSILIVEDEFINAKFIEDSILQLGHRVVANVQDATEAFAVVKNYSIDFVFMDINLESSINGIMCAEILNRENDIPIIYMSAFDDNQTIDEASHSNIYGYLIKPFTKQNIKATLTVAIQRFEKRLYGNAKVPLQLLDGYDFCLDTKTLRFQKKVVSLSKKESDILFCLASSLNTNISYEILMQEVWGNKDISFSTVRDTVLRLRKKAPTLGLDNVISVGYCLRNV